MVWGWRLRKTSDDCATLDRYDPIRLATWRSHNIMIPTGLRVAATLGTWCVTVRMSGSG